MTREEAAQLKPGDMLEYELSLEAEGYGVLVRRYVLSEFVKPSKNSRRVVIRPMFREEGWNRARAVGIDKLRKWG
ncbi:MAG TPA: hypothetical protein VFU72_08825 [Nitrolancea sp.]|nr:hypothetical protein [Nitrolancea sp.]